MILRRALYVAQFPLAVVLPVWVLVTRGIVADGIGWQFLVYLVACPILFVALAVICGLVVARKDVRVTRALSWLDTGLWLAIVVTLTVYGLFALPLLAVLVVIEVIAMFWAVVYELFHETKRRVTTYLDLPAEKPRPNIDGPTSGPHVIVIPPQPPA